MPISSTKNLFNKRYDFRLTPSQKVVLLIAGIFLLIFTADFFSHSTIKFNNQNLGELSLPFHLNPNSNLTITIPGSTSRDLMALDILISEKPTISIKNSDGTLTRISHYQCNKSDRRYDCHIPFSRGRQPTLLELKTQEKNVSVDSAHLRVLKSFSNTMVGTGSLLPYILIFTFFLPVLWAIYNKRILSEYLILSLSIACLFWLQSLFTGILLIYLFVIYQLGMKMQRARQNESQNKGRTLLLYTGLLTSIAFLVFWKYGGKIALTIFANPGNFSLAMPLGISYFIIRVIDTILRWYRGEVKHTTFREFLCFVIFPATIPAGPIDTLDNFMSNRVEKISNSDIAYGLARVLLGVAKKIIIVGLILQTVLFSGENNIYSRVIMAPTLASTQDVIILPFFMMLYAYLDFSAYSDIAIGFSRLMGYKMVENFYWPIFSKNIQEFWKRWHMSLSGWCMRNIFMPTTIKTRNTILPLYITMLTVGLWHAFSLTWFFWAMHHGTGLSFFTFADKRKYFKQNHIVNKLLSVVKIPFTITFVASGYYFAFVNDFSTAWKGYVHFWKCFII
jgi:alginate O-acetyltransferase complex protein AlgI